MKCPICDKKVLKGRRYADRRMKLRMLDGTPRLIHTACHNTFLSIKSFMQRTGCKQWKGIKL